MKSIQQRRRRNLGSLLGSRSRVLRDRRESRVDGHSVRHDCGTRGGRVNGCWYVLIETATPVSLRP